MVLVDSHGISRVPRYSGTCRESTNCRLRGSHPLWPIVPDRSTKMLVAHSPALRPDRSYNPTVQARWFGLIRVRSPLLAESLLFSLPPGTEMVHFPGLSSPPYGFRWRYSGMSLSGLPHSEIFGSKPVCGSPKLFAAYHVLHRLLAPRHSPYALSSLTKCSLTHCACVIKKLPIAGYSVVKELPRLSARRLSAPSVSAVGHQQTFVSRWWRIPGSNR